MDCHFDKDSIEEACFLLAGIAKKLDLVTDKLLDNVVDRSNKQTKVHFITMLVTIGLLGGIQVFNTYVERGRIAELERHVGSEMATVRTEGSSKP